MDGSSNRLQTLDRGIEVLLMVAREPSVLTVADIAGRMNLARPIAYRLVATLAAHDMLRRMENGRLLLGSGALVLASLGDRHIRALARSEMEALAEATQTTAFLSVAQGTECVAIVTAEPRGAFMNIRYRVGSRHSLNVGAAGLAILAGRGASPDDPERVEQARRQGYCVTRGELQPGAIGVSSPVPKEFTFGMEFSVGVVALGTLDVDSVAVAVRNAAANLAASLHAKAGS